MIFRSSGVSRSFSRTVVDFDGLCLTYPFSVEPKDFPRSLRMSLCHLERPGKQGCLMGIFDSASYDANLLFSVV